jgi:toxin ParE1/3/4
MTRYEVVLSAGAQRDLEAICDCIVESGSPARADHVLARLLEAADRLAELPQRGSYPRELLALGIREYRQSFFKPYRLIYRVLDHRVCIYLIADGRRNMESLLARRLLGQGPGD